MLSQLAIRNYAIVDQLDIEFRPGMSAITGETGAGKSIILGALGLALGDRADKDSVAGSASKADITAHFDLRDLHLASEWLREHELLSVDDTDSCMLRRVVSADGRSRAWVNGFPVTLQQLKTIGEMLIDIHSQHEHQSLLNRSTHLRLLDEFAAQQALAGEVRQLHRQWKSTRQQLEELRSDSEARLAQQQLVRYQLDELQALGLEEGELAALDQEYRELNSADQSLDTVRQLLEICSDNEQHNVLAAISRAQALLEDLPVLPASLAGTVELLSGAAIQIEEAVSEFNRSVDGFEANPQRLQEINQRMADIQALARKHRSRPEELAQLCVSLQEQLQGALDNEEALAQLEKQADALYASYRLKAAALSKQRKNAAERLASGINQQLAELGMPNARLQVQLTATPEDQHAATGLESVEFLVSTNPGQPAKPLIKIASGGELSRISLAIQVVTAKTSVIPTLVFDEVDVGIGGAVAKSVGRLLRELGEHGQVLSVTHQALVAAQAHQHLFVSKSSSKSAAAAAIKATRTTIRELSEQERVEEIARMLGGEQETGFSPESLAHAQELVR